MDEMTQSVDHITDAVTRVKEISDENKENISALSKDITRFKVD
jgi:methyl-accepting chemotaxis protein